jgi:subtilase family serine protease
VLASLILWGCLPTFGQTRPQNRIRQVNPNVTMVLRGTINPRAKPTFDTGPADPANRLTGMTIHFRLSAAQQAALDNLVQQQQTPGSSLYHQWITPAQYAQRFGLSDSDLEKVETWLEQQGFSIDGVANSRNAITFSGTIGQVESAFQTSIHHYNIHGVTHRSNAGPLSIPTAFSGVVLSVRNISNFRPHPLHRFRPREQTTPQYTFNSGSTHSHFLAPADFATIYNVNPLYGAGYTGDGQTIVVTGQSAIVTSDITNFQKAAGLPQKAPKLVLVPNTGSSTVDDSTGDEDESDLDIEWSGAIAKGADIVFVYVGEGPNHEKNYSVFDSIKYAVDNNLAPIITTSYGTCEQNFPSADVQTLQGIFEQANAQGQTIIAAGGDSGATDCESSSSTNSDQATHGLAVDLPASSPYVTGIGGTEFAADVSSPGSYWNSSNGAGGSSAIRYIPEKVWNDTSTTLGIQAGGGGASALFSKPSWQTGTGVPNDGKRDVPDISLNASPNHDGYLVCASGADSTSCSNGFLNKSGVPNVAGGTSFGAPIFSGILAILEQKLQSKGLGNVNPNIYSLAASSYSTAFHDTTSGNNQIPCKIGSTDCSKSPIGYSATAGYDLASGWGSINAANFVNGLGAVKPPPNATTTVLTASTTAPVVNTAVTLTATVTSNSGGAAPSGTVQFVIDGANAGAPLTLSSGSATYSYTPTTAGSHTIVANYTPSNPSVNAASSSTLILTVSAAASGGTLQLSATDVTVARGSSGVSTVAVTSTPQGFTGSVSLSVSAPATLTNACFTYVNPTATSNGSVTVYTSKSACTGIGSGRAQADSGQAPKSGSSYLPGAMLAGLLLLGLPGARRRRILFGAVLLLAILGFGITACGTSSGTSSTSPAGKYTLTLTGTDTQQNLSATTTFTLTVN